MVEDVAVVTALVVTENVPVEAPAAIVIDAGTVADVEVDERVTVMAPVVVLGVAFKVTVAVEDAPPTNVAGESAMLVMAKGLTVNAAVLLAPLKAAVIVVEVDAVTTLCVTVKVAVVAPAATVTDVGTVPAAVAELVNVTTFPLGPAALLRVTVPVIVTLLPPTTVEDERVTPETLAGDSVSVAVLEPEPIAAVIVALELADTAFVATVKVAVVAPAATVTEAGKVALVLLEVSVTTWPPVGAGPVKVTVPVDDAPPTKDVGERATLLTAGDVMVSIAVEELEPIVAVIVDDVEAATAVDVIVNVAVVIPDTTVTDAGTEALVLLDFNVTTVPAAGAAAEIVTVPVLDTPPTTEVGLSVTELTV